ncbi:Ldh family oxidoreductase [Ectothiorhodospiraceae bacterium WFHF3C12]|nr:Ldh family oxidoreductase [Ectothiorhodospiraceae bacterium WFHF3C12]
MTDTVHLSLEEVHALARDALRRLGCSEPQAGAIADTVTAAERDECQSHGLFRIPFYARVIATGRPDPRAEPEISELAPAVARVDGRMGFAPLALQRGAAPLAERARSQGIAALSVNNVFHIAALWPEVERLAEQGLVAFAFTGAINYVAPAGGTRPLFGTNPMAFAWPRENGPPVVFDQASSVSARGEIQIRRRDGVSLPAGWAVGPDGAPTTDPDIALKGAQLPFGGHKGSAIAMMVELLAGALIGDLFSYEAGERDADGTGAPQGGELMIAIDPARCTAGGEATASLGHAEQLFSRILEQEGTRLPSQRRVDARRRTLTAGVEVPRSLVERIGALG